MPSRKKDPWLGKRYLRNWIVLGVPFLLACVAGVYAHQHNRMDWFMIAFIVGAVIALTGLIYQEKLFRSYECPQCGKKLAESPRKNGQPIEFLCSQCDVIWDSGFIESDVGSN